MASKKIGLKDVAERAGVSKTTVSYVLNNVNVPISQETRERVLKIAEEMNYRPNWMAQGLKLSRYNVVGVVVEDIRSFFINSVIDGICRCAEEIGVKVVLLNLRNDDRADTHNGYDLRESGIRIEAAIRNVFGNQVDSIIYVGAFYRDVSKVFHVDDYNVSYAYCYCANELCVHYDDYQGGKIAAEYLIRHGHSKIGYYNALGDTQPGKERTAGFTDALLAAGLTLRPEWLCGLRNDQRKAYEWARELLSNEDAPTAIWGNTDDVCLGIYKACRELGLKIPEDLSVIGFDNKPYGSSIVPSLTTVEFPASQIGYTIMKAVCQDKVKKESIKLDCGIIERESVCGPKRKKGV